MGIPLAAGAARLLWIMTKGALRQTKRLSPWKRATKGQGKKIKGLYVQRAKGKKGHGVGGTELRPWAKTIFGNKGLLRKTGLSATKTRQSLYGYSRGTKHLAKHKKLYGSGVAGAAIWDFLPGKDNE